MLNTERHSPRFKGLDTWPREDVLAALWEGQMAAIACLRPALPALARAAQAIEARLVSGGRLIFVGAGSSGLLALQDALELGSTYNWPEDRLAVMLAGGLEGLSLNGMPGAAEDDAQTAKREFAALSPVAADAVIGVAASGGTPYTVAALEEADAAGCLTIGIANNADTRLLQVARHPVLLDSGPEVVAGSTRMAAGTAQKAALGLLSTVVQIKNGHVVDGHMIDLLAENEKLRLRARRMVQDIADVDDVTAAEALAVAGGQVKLSVLIASGLTADQARTLLNTHDGNLLAALSALPAAS